MQQHDVAGDAADARFLVDVVPPARDLAEEAVGRVAGREPVGDHPLDARERVAFDRLGVVAAGHAFRVHERLGAVETLEIGDERVELRRRAAASPIQQPSASR